MKKILLAILLLNSSFNCWSQIHFPGDYQNKTAIIPAYIEKSNPVANPTVTVNINFSDTISAVSKYIFGNNANPYMSRIVNEPALLKNIRRLSPNIIRFPGGNLCSLYFWNQPQGQRPNDAPHYLIDQDGKKTVAKYWYGKNNPIWSISLDDYYKMLKETGSTGIITVNYGYARYGEDQQPVAKAAHLAADWVRYDGGRTKFWEIGNESNGFWQAGYKIDTTKNKDGQPEIISGRLYGKHFKVFADSMHKAATEIGAKIYLGAQLLHGMDTTHFKTVNKPWNEGVYSEAGNLPDFFIIHSYYTKYKENSSPVTILNTATHVTRDMIQFINTSMKESGIAQKPVALTEWNIFAEGSQQSVSYINGMHSAMVLGELIKGKYGMACRWDLANGWNKIDHGMFSQGDDPDGAKARWNPRSPFFYMYYFQKIIGDHLFQSKVEGDTNVIVYASKYTSGEAGIVMINKDTKEKLVKLNPSGFAPGKKLYLYTLTGGSDNGDFSPKVFVNGQGPAAKLGGPIHSLEQIKAFAYTIDKEITVLSPARCVQYILVENQKGRFNK